MTWSVRRSPKRPDRVLAVPVAGLRPERCEACVHAVGRRDQFDETGRGASVLHGPALEIGNTAAGRHGRAMGEHFTLGDAALYFILDLVAVNGEAEMVEPIANLVDRLLVDRWLVVEALQQLDVHRAGKAHRDLDVAGAGLAAKDM